MFTSILLSAVVALPLKPDPKLTPGAVLPTTTEQICKTGYSNSVRNVSASTKKRVFALYHVTPKKGAFEVDHLISLELGGKQ